MKTKNERIAWLAGILDGEGYVFARIVRAKRKNRSKFVQKKRVYRLWRVESSLQFGVRISNSDVSMINEIASIADDVGIKYFRTEHDMKNKNHSHMFLVHFASQGRVAAFLTLVLPWLLTKKKVAEEVLATIVYRRSMKYNSSIFGDSLLDAHLAEIARLNRRGRGTRYCSEPALDQFSA